MIEMVHGVHYIKGGMYGLAQGLLQLGQDHGVKVELNADVQEIIIDPKFKRADVYVLMVIFDVLTKCYVLLTFHMWHKT